VVELYDYTMTHLNDNVLVLNRSYQAVNICPAWRAGSLLFTGNAEVCLIDYTTYDFGTWMLVSSEPTADNQNLVGSDIIGTSSGPMLVPHVIRLTHFDSLPRKEVRFTRHSVFERDHHTCQYCGVKFGKRSVHNLNLDHVIPKEQGGSTSWENITTSCIPCNTKKANRTPLQAGMSLLKVPKKPQWRAFVAVPLNEIMRESWEKFMDVASWPVEISGHPSTVGIAKQKAQA